MKVSYNWLKDYLGEDTPEAEILVDLLTFQAFEVESLETQGADKIIEVKILPDRSSDCLCHRGIAREIATLLNRPLLHDPLSVEPTLPNLNQISVQIDEPTACPRFTASLITDVTVRPSPQWLQDRLLAIGQRPINNLVDATNYVMFALGQPLHAYDADLFPQVNGQWRFLVRFARLGERVSLLPEGSKKEDRIIECKGTELLIVDASSDVPIGLAGVKGGSFAGVHARTKKIIIEAAHFNPTLTRKTARSLGIVIDASKRFENEPSRILPPYAQAEIVKLIGEIAGGKGEGMIDVYLERKDPKPVMVTVAKANALLGLSLTATTMASYLRRAGITVEETPNTFTCTGPLERTDLTLAEDFIAEIGRIHGYKNIVAVVPNTVPLKEVNARHYYSESVRQILVEKGFSEVITSSFVGADKIQLKNALAADKSYLRSSLTDNLKAALDSNAGRADLFGREDTRIFEIGTVFTRGGQTGIIEHFSLALGVRVKSSGYTGKEDRIINEVISELEQSFSQKIDFKLNNGIAEVNFSQLFNQLPQPNKYHLVKPSSAVTFERYSVYPHSSRDIALWVSEGTCANDVESILNEAASALRVRTTLFDEFTKDGRTSYAFRLVFQSKEKTLTDEEVNAVMDAVSVAVTEKGWEVR